MAGSARSRATRPPRLRPDEPEDELYWSSLRWNFTFPEEEAYMQTSTLGASPAIVTEAVVSHLRYIESSLPKWDYSPDKPEKFAGYRPETALRTKLASFLGCDMEEVGLTQNATMGMNFVANGIDLEAGDEVVFTTQEHPGGRCGWDVKAKRFGIVLKEVEIPAPPNDPEELVRRWLAATTPRTKVWAIPHVTSGLGLIHPVKALGHFRVNVRDLGCDAYFGSPHKWMLAPKGNGILYVRREVQPRIWTTLASSQWDNQKDGMFRLMQYGTLNLSLVRGLEVALDFLERIGMERIERRIRFLGERLRAGLREIPGVSISSSVHPELACGMTTWKVEGMDSRVLQEALWDRGRVRVRSVGDFGVRTSTHVYVSPAEIDRLLQIARELAA
jgi:selenocysteine lyase/cysteine desulfurase